jgi:type VI secretion system VasD/TssJ family lipoprotein
VTNEMDHGFMNTIGFCKTQPYRFQQRILVWVGGCCLTISLAGCAAVNSMVGGNTPKDALALTAWDFAESAVQIEILAEPNLNQYESEPHTLLLGVYQMEDPAAFQKLTADPMLLGKALESGKGSDAFVRISRYVVSPGQQTKVALDRAQKAQFIGIVVGYYQMGPTNCARLFNVPIVMESKGLIGKAYTATPAKLALRLNLGSDRILNVQRIEYEPSLKTNLETVPLNDSSESLRQIGAGV